VLETVPIELSRKQVDKSNKPLFSDSSKGYKTYLDERKDRIIQLHKSRSLTSRIEMEASNILPEPVYPTKDPTMRGVNNIETIGTSRDEVVQLDGDSTSPFHPNSLTETVCGTGQEPTPDMNGPIDGVTIEGHNESTISYSYPNEKRRDNYKSQFQSACIRFEGEVPSSYDKDVVQVRRRYKIRYETITEVLHSLFAIQPIWSKKNLLQHKLLYKSPNGVKVILPEIAYCYLSGPFKGCWIRYGYNALTDSYSKIFSTITIRFSKQHQMSSLKRR
jgi:RNA polymerase III transcription factor (TF)IIIC subunit HTH domain